MPRRSKPDEYAVEGVDYTEWSSSDDDADGGIEAAVGLNQVQSRVFSCLQFHSTTRSCSHLRSQAATCCWYDAPPHHDASACNPTPLC